MLITLNKIVNNDCLNLDIDFSVFEFKDDPYVRRIENVFGYIDFYHDSIDQLRIEYQLEGNFICPCAITLEDVEVPFNVSDDDYVTFDENKDGFYIFGDMSLEELVVFILTPEIPIKVVKNDKIDYSIRGEFAFVRDDDYISLEKDDIDPRLQKLKDYKFEEDD